MKIDKLGLGIVAFEGTEHIKNITYELRPYCDVITVCLQKESYYGEPIKQKDVDIIENLKKLGYIDTIIWFEPTDMHTDRDEGDAPRLIETDKRNFICDYFENTEKCSHCLMIDSDEYYDGDDFKFAKGEFEKDPDIHVSYCEYVNYWRDYQHVMVWPFNCFVPFISETKYRFDFDKGNFTQPSDPTRRYLVQGEMHHFNVFSWQAVKMHHLSWIRLEIENKINAWSSKNLFKDVDNLKEAILDRYYNYRDGLNAILMFHTPYNQVQVNILPKQYIHPHFMLDEEPTKSYDEERNPNNLTYD